MRARSCAASACAAQRAPRRRGASNYSRRASIARSASGSGAQQRHQAARRGCSALPGAQICLGALQQPRRSARSFELVDVTFTALLGRCANSLPAPTHNSTALVFEGRNRAAQRWSRFAFALAASFSFLCSSFHSQSVGTRSPSARRRTQSSPPAPPRAAHPSVTT